jgi:hypothetical protein
MHRTKMAYYLLLKEFDAKFFSPAQDDKQQSRANCGDIYPH